MNRPSSVSIRCLVVWQVEIVLADVPLQEHRSELALVQSWRENTNAELDSTKKGGSMEEAPPREGVLYLRKKKAKTLVAIANVTS